MRPAMSSPTGAAVAPQSGGPGMDPSSGVGLGGAQPNAGPSP